MRVDVKSCSEFLKESIRSEASKLGVLVATDDTGVVTRLYREALSFIETSVEHLVCSDRFILYVHVLH